MPIRKKYKSMVYVKPIKDIAIKNDDQDSKTQSCQNSHCVGYQVNPEIIPFGLFSSFYTQLCQFLYQAESSILVQLLFLVILVSGPV